MSVIACFLGFSEGDGRVLASSFQVFLVGYGMLGKEEHRKCPLPIV